MPYNPEKHHRRSIRFKGYDYTSAGAYFVTICTHQRHCLFGDVMDSAVNLNQTGFCIQTCWQNLPNHFLNVNLDVFVVMPNHIHGILWLCGDALSRGEAFALGFNTHSLDLGANASPLQAHGTKPKSIGAIIQNFKSISTRKINRMAGVAGMPVWQRNYYEHIIRSEAALQTIRAYIDHNPLSWEQDQLHPANPSKW